MSKHQYDFIYQNDIVDSVHHNDIVIYIKSSKHNDIIIYLKFSNKTHLKLLYLSNTVIKANTSRLNHI